MERQIARNWRERDRTTLGASFGRHPRAAEPCQGRGCGRAERLAGEGGLAAARAWLLRSGGDSADERLDPPRHHGRCRSPSAPSQHDLNHSYARFT